MTNDERIAEIQGRAEEAKKWAAGCDRTRIGCQIPQIISSINDGIPYLLSQLAEKDAEIERLRAAQRWIPVSDPPESGVHVWLCCVTPSGKQYACDGYYAAPKSIICDSGGDCNSEYDEEKDEYFLLEGFYEVVKNWDDFSSVAIEDSVTHWMPLPTAPEKED